MGGYLLNRKLQGQKLPKLGRLQLSSVVTLKRLNEPMILSGH